MPGLDLLPEDGHEAVGVGRGGQGRLEGGEDGVEHFLGELERGVSWVWLDRDEAGMRQSGERTYGTDIVEVYIPLRQPIGVELGRRRYVQSSRVCTAFGEMFAVASFWPANLGARAMISNDRSLAKLEKG